MSELQFSEYLTLLASWTKQSGITILDRIPLNSKEEVCKQYAERLFSALHSLIGDFNKLSNHSMYFTLPLTFHEKITRTLIWKADNNEILWISVIFSDIISDDQIKNIDSLLSDCEFKLRMNPGGKYSFPQEFSHNLENIIKEIYQIEIPQVKIGESYSITAAIEDFKKGIAFFQEKNWAGAFPLLQKALIKFKLENQPKLQMEAIYLLATLLVQLKKYSNAVQYYIELIEFAHQYQHNLYLETAIFMKGFCLFKIGNYEESLKGLEQMQIESSKNINPILFYTILGRLYVKRHLHEQAIINLKKALSTGLKSPQNEQNQKQNAQLLYDLGLEYYFIVIERIRKNGFSNIQIIFQNSQDFLQSIEYLMESIKIWQELKEFSLIIEIYQIVGNIYGYLKDYSKQINIYNIAMNNAEKINDFRSQLQLVELIIPVYNLQNQYSEIIQLLQKKIELFVQQGFIDTFTLARLHIILGETYYKANFLDNAINEYITALNFFQTFENPYPDELNILEFLSNLYKEQNNHEKAKFYQEIKQQRQRKQIQKSDKKTIPNLNIITDIWFFMKSGIEIFSYSPTLSFDPTLFGGLVTAMQGIGMELQGGRMGSFVIGNSRYQFYLEEDKPFFTIGRTSILNPEESVDLLLQKIYHRFYKEFMPNLINFSGDTAPFHQFLNILNNEQIE